MFVHESNLTIIYVSVSSFCGRFQPLHTGCGAARLGAVIRAVPRRAL